jgi:hypothetical protein
VARSVISYSELDLGSLRIAPGSHSSPREGVCVVELASLLAGEKLSDHPRCVCDVIAAFLRSLNDRVAHGDRQKLRPYADLTIGSRGNRQITRQRRDICLASAGAGLGGGRLRGVLERLAMRARIFLVVGLGHAIRLNQGAGEYAARVAFARLGTEEAFALLDRLLAVGEAAAPAENGRRNGRRLEAAPLSDPVVGSTQARVPAAIRELAGDAQVSQHENGAQAAHHNGDAGDLGRRDAGQGHEEDIENDHAGDGDPERETEPAEDLHRLSRLP